MVRSFHSFSVKLDVKHAFFGLLLKKWGIYMSSTLVSAHGLKTPKISDYIVERYDY